MFVPASPVLSVGAGRLRPTGVALALVHGPAPAALAARARTVYSTPLLRPMWRDTRSTVAMPAFDAVEIPRVTDEISRCCIPSGLQWRPL